MQNLIVSKLTLEVQTMIQNFTKNPNKLNYIYVLTPKGIAEKAKLTLNFMKRKMQEYEDLKEELEKINKNKESQ